MDVQVKVSWLESMRSEKNQPLRRKRRATATMRKAWLSSYGLTTLMRLSRCPLNQQSFLNRRRKRSLRRSAIWKSPQVILNDDWNSPSLSSVSPVQGALQWDTQAIVGISGTKQAPSNNARLYFTCWDAFM